MAITRMLIHCAASEPVTWDSAALLRSAPANGSFAYGNKPRSQPLPKAGEATACDIDQVNGVPRRYKYAARGKHSAQQELWLGELRYGGVRYDLQEDGPYSKSSVRNEMLELMQPKGI